MNKNIIIKNFIIAVKEKNSFFWLIIFPFILANVFGVAFTKLEKSANVIEPMNIMVESPYYREVLSKINYNGKYLYKIMEYENPEKALEDGKIKAYINGSIVPDAEKIKKEMDIKGIKINITESEKEKYIKTSAKGYEKIRDADFLKNNKNFYGKNDMKFFIDEINLGKLNINIKNTSDDEKILIDIVNSINKSSMGLEYIINNELKSDNKAYNLSDRNNILNKINSEEKEEDLKNKISGSQKSTIVVMFYALLAMTCLGAMNFGITAMESINFDSEEGYSNRLLISPIPKHKIVVSFALPLFILNSIMSIVIYLFIRYFYKIEFGGTQIQLIFGIICANIMALVLGMMFSVLVKCKSSIKYSISAIFYVASGFLSGMMSTNTYGYFLNKFQAINYINPATVIGKMFLSLYLSSQIKYYWFSIINISLITLVAGILTLAIYKYRIKRREKNGSF